MKLTATILTTLAISFNSIGANAMIILRPDPLNATNGVKDWITEVRKIAKNQITSFNEPPTGYTEIREVAGYPGIFFSLSFMQSDMNKIYNRVSTYAEEEVGGKKNVIISLSSLHYKASNKIVGGHDLKSSDLTYVFNQLKKAERSGRKTYQMNSHEREFSEKVLSPLQKQFKNKPFVIVSYSIQNMWPYQMVFSHEIIHGQYFLSKKFRQVVHDYWTNIVTEKDRQKVKEILGIEGSYDDKNEELMKNEFAAYVLQSAPEWSRLDCIVPLYRLGLMKKLNRAGISPVQVK